MALPLSQQQQEDRRAAEARYRASVEQTMKRWRDYQDHQMKLVRDDLMVYQRHIIASMADVTEWDAHRIEQVTKMLDQARSDLYKRFNHSFEDVATEVSTLALDSIDKPLAAFGVNIGSVGRQLPIAQLNYLRSVTPSLIQNVTATVHAEVQQLLYTHAHGGMTKQELLKRIGAATGPLNGKADLKPGQVIPRAEVRARTIFRTETNRMASIIQQDRLEQFAKRDKGVGSRWIHWPSQQPRHDHTALHGQVIFRGHDEFFHLDGIMITGPHDPRLPAAQVINCHCKVVVTYDPDKSDDQSDPVIASAGSGGGALAPTPAPPAPPAPKKPRKAAAKPATLAPPAKPGAVRKGGTFNLDPLPPRPGPGATRVELEEHINRLLELDAGHYPSGVMVMPNRWTTRQVFTAYTKDDQIAGVAHCLHDLAEESRRLDIPFITSLRTGKGDGMSMGSGQLTIGRGARTKAHFAAYGRRQVDPKAAAAYKRKLVKNCTKNLADAREWGCADDFIAQLEADLETLNAWDGTGIPTTGLGSTVGEFGSMSKGDLGLEKRWFRADGCVQALPGSNLPAGKSAPGPLTMFTSDTNLASATGRYQITYGTGQPHNAGVLVPEGWSPYAIRHEFGHHVANVFHYSRTGLAADLRSWGRAGRNPLTRGIDGGALQDEMSNLFALSRPQRNFISQYADWGGRAWDKYKVQQGNEWFAENYTAYISGAINDVEPSWLAFARKWELIP